MLHRTAKLIVDELSKFLGDFPNNSKDASTIVASVRVYEGDPGKGGDGRRWWTDGAAELAAAANEIRRRKPLAHYKGIANRPQSRSIGERAIRATTEGGRAQLVQSGHGEAWWPLATRTFAMAA